MAHNRLYFLVGLFVTIGVGLGVAAVVWLGASKYFQKGSMYSTYFDESVQGLQADSIVKFRGVDIGTVKKIGVAPDQRLVEVIMKLDVKDFNVSGVVAKLSLAGITGIVYVELDRKKPGEPSLRPSAFRPPYPVIPSSPSDIKQIESGVNEVLKSIKEIDFKGISTQMAKAAKGVDDLVNGEEMKRVVSEAGTAAARLASVSERIDTFMAGGSPEKIAAEAREAIKEARTAIARVRSEVEALHLGPTVNRVNDLVEGTAGRVDSTMTEVEVTAETLRRAADTMESLVDRLNADPSMLIFSRPPKGD